MGSKFRNKHPIRLGDVCKKIGSGATPRGGSKSYQSDGVSLIRSQNVFINMFSIDGLAHINKKQAEQLDIVKVEKDDILLNITGESVGRVCQVPDDVLPARVNQHVSIIRPDCNILDPSYLCYYLSNPLTQIHLLALSSAGATRKALTKGMIEDLMIDAPPIEIQRQIASILISLDRKLSVHKKISITLEKIAQSIFKHWFIDFEFPNAEGKPYKSSGGPVVNSELGEIPNGWEIKSFSDAIEINPKRKLPKGKNARKIGMADLTPWQSWIDTWTYESFSSGPSFKNNDILFARITPSLEHGKTALVSVLDLDEVAFGSTEFIVFAPKLIKSPYFIFCLSREQNIRDIAIGSMSGSSGRQRVPNEVFDYIQVAVPPDNLVKKFDSYVSQMFQMIKTNASEIRSLSKTHETLLPKLMAGKIRVNSKEKARKVA